MLCTLMRCLVVLLLLTVPASAQEWYEVKSPDVGLSNWVLKFTHFDSLNIIAYGNLHAAIPFMIASHDGGHSWTDTVYHKKGYGQPGFFDFVVDPNDAGQCAMPDEEHVFIAGKAGKLMYSDNGGRSMNIKVVDSSKLSLREYQYSAIHFDRDMRAGLLLEGYSSVLITTDTGKTWVRRSLNRSDTNETGGPWHYRFLDSRTFHSVNYNTEKRQWSVSVTTDMGMTWRTNPLGDTSIWIHDGCIVDDSVSYYVGYRSNDADTVVGGDFSIVFKTTDGGRTWKKILDSLVIDYPTKTYPFGLNAVTFYDRRLGMVTGNHQILLTTNGGETWRPMQSGFTEKPIGMWAHTFLSPTTALIGRYDGSIARWEQGRISDVQDTYLADPETPYHLVTTGELRIPLPNKTFSVSLLTMSGRTVVQQSACTSDDIIPLHGLPTGIYAALVRSDTTIRRFLVNVVR